MRLFTLIIISSYILSCQEKVKESDGDITLLEYQKEVLAKNKPGSEYIFKMYPDKGYLEYSLVYLGKTTTAKSKAFKFINCIAYSGLLKDSRRANSSIYIFNEINELIGQYQLGPIWSLPKSLDNNNLVFDFNNEYCNQKTLISYLDSIPKKIFIPCTENGGDVYIFSRGK